MNKNIKTKNSLVYIQARQVPIIVSFAEATEVQRVHADKTLDNKEIIWIDNKTFTKGQIKYVEVLHDGSRNERWNETILKNNEEGFETRRKFLLMSPEEKARELEPFKLLYKCSTGNDAGVDDLIKAEVAQVEFYRNNPDRMICDFSILKALIPKEKQLTAINRWYAGGLRFLEEAYREDFKYEKRVSF